MYKFFGQPLQEVKSIATKKVIVVFDTKGEYYSNDDKFIEKLKPHFKYKNLDEQVKEEVTEQPKEEIKDENNEPPKPYKCKKCEEGFANIGQLNKHKKECI